MSNVELRVRESIAKALDVDLSQVELEHTFKEDLAADSLELVEVIIALEEEFSIDIPDERAERISTIQQAVDCVEEILAMNE